MPHPHLSAEMLGLGLASETPGVSQVISREDDVIEIIKPSQEQLVQSVIHNNIPYVAVPYRTPSQRGLVVRAKYFGISHARGHRFRTAVSKA